MANHADPDETACCEPSPLDLHCLHRHLVWTVGLKGLMQAGKAVLYISVSLFTGSRNHGCGCSKIL